MKRKMVNKNMILKLSYHIKQKWNEEVERSARARVEVVKSIVECGMLKNAMWSSGVQVVSNVDNFILKTKQVGWVYNIYKVCCYTKKKGLFFY